MIYDFYDKIPDGPILEKIAMCSNAGVPELKKTSEGDIYEKLVGREKVIIQVVRDEDEVVAFKIGYELRPRLFYSWFGGVREDYRGRGIGSELMLVQHDYCTKENYESIRTISSNVNKEMIVRNLRSGFDIVDLKTKDDEIRIVFEKRLRYSH